MAQRTDQPTPRRGWDWVAFVEGSDEESRATAFGASAEEAIASFKAGYCPCDIDGVKMTCNVNTECMRKWL